MMKTTRSTHRSEWFYLSLISIPLVLLVALFAVGKVRESLAAGDVKAILANWTEEGKPINTTSFANWSNDAASDERSAAWLDVLSATYALWDQFASLKARNEGREEELAAEGEPWAEGLLEEPFVERAQPIIEQVQKLLAEDTSPVWLPSSRFSRHSSISDYHYVNLLTDLMSREFRVAVHEGDRSRAMLTLEMMKQVADAFDTKSKFGLSRFRMFSDQQRYLLIRQSLELGFWTEPEQFEQLRGQLEPLDDLVDRVKHSVASENALDLDYYTSRSTGCLSVEVMGGVDFAPYGTPSAAIRKLLEEMESDTEQIRELEKGLAEYRRKPKREKRNDSPRDYSVVNVPYATILGDLSWFRWGIDGRVDRMQKIDFERRWTLVTIAIKQFRMQEGRWPSELTELSKVGFSPQDCARHDGITLGYEVDNEDDVAYTWYPMAIWDFDVNISRWVTERPDKYDASLRYTRRGEIQVFGVR
ncbi:hypothetical protein CA13_22680 [Planctomycetes bacterium CA13]|uniref:Uncharacterized protein n=1 Tax=Novipirellula herctigrandis TaxID=2527986 RepID=A0A5C5Z0C1_9BACT|nr:hypothetical protein CA13_22680 [Planctomycetes bacterium CA13]